jgi:S-adenosylmethionine:tRNA ribosyltransferase-isomerase
MKKQHLCPAQQLVVLMDPRSIDISAFDYLLPEDRIAVRPMQPRDHSRLLIYRSGEIQERLFRDLSEELESGSQLCINDSRVIPARLVFEKPSGGRIEIFCLEPDTIYSDVSTALGQRTLVQWRCLIGGASKWKNGQVLQHPLPGLPQEDVLTAHFLEKMETDFRIEFRWPESAGTFAEVLERAGRIPLPPYIKRASDSTDRSDYQTAYAREDGSVAAPTAGLHFTDELLNRLQEKQIERLPLTLHVGAGTFKPVTATKLSDHTMHGEWIHLKKETLEKLLSQSQARIAVGTTVLRTLESIYWLGHRLCRNEHASLDHLTQWEPYEQDENISVQSALEAILNRMEKEQTESLWSRTELLIAPGYRLRLADALITNFHQPRSTLLLLVSAFVGGDWKRIYNHALQQDFRFLSYGDSSLLWRVD